MSLSTPPRHLISGPLGNRPTTRNPHSTQGKKEYIKKQTDPSLFSTIELSTRRSQQLSPSMKFQTSAHLDSKVPYGVGAGVSRSRGQPASLPYIILDNHISETEGLHLLGRIVRNVRRPLECYVPSGTSTCAPSGTTEPGSSHSPSHSAP